MNIYEGLSLKELKENMESFIMLVNGDIATDEQKMKYCEQIVTLGLMVKKIETHKVKYTVPKCDKCNGELICYDEQIIEKQRKINKDGKLSKRFRLVDSCVSGASGIVCSECLELFDFGLDEKGRVVDVEQK